MILTHRTFRTRRRRLPRRACLHRLFFDAIATKAFSKLDGFSPQDVANTAWALSKVCEPPLHSAFFEALWETMPDDLETMTDGCTINHGMLIVAFIVRKPEEVLILVDQRGAQTDVRTFTGAVAACARHAATLKSDECQIASEN